MKKQLISTGLGTVLAIISATAHTSTDDITLAEVMALLKSQQAEIETLKKQLAKTNQKVDATAGAVETVASSTESYAKIASWADKTHLGGYGELHYNDKENGKSDEVDNHRFVLFLEHEFTDDVRLVSEVELEHSISGEGKAGEVEVEQAYIEWDYADNHSATFGQFLIPVGLLNETHEPDTFYGVERNPVEKNIIPATWWEAGVKIRGELAAALSYDLAIHSGLETDISGSKAFEIRNGRQKVSKASADAFAYTGRLKYTGFAGLELALAVQYQEDVTQGLGADEASALFWEGHFTYQIDDFSLRGLYASWDIDGDEAESFGRDEQSGWYIEPSYRLSPKLGVFARYSEWDLNEGNQSDTEIDQLDLGLSFWLVENVVLKVDWADQSNGDGDSFNLGLGWSF